MQQLGNPTGQVLSRENLEAIIKFAYNNRLIIIADEVRWHLNFFELKKRFQFLNFSLFRFIS